MTTLRVPSAKRLIFTGGLQARATSISAVVLFALLAGVGGRFVHPTACAQDDSRIDFNRDIRPLLSDRCFACHGPDEAARKSDLRLDEPTRVTGKENSVVVPGKSAESILFQRITSTDPEQVMPPADFSKHLTDAEKELFRRWIDEGAAWEIHWSYQPVVKHEPPAIPGVSHPVDQFIRARLPAGLRPSAEADRVALIRRLYFDLIGLPPTWQQVQAFVHDGSPTAYDKVVDELLQSPHFGERLAIYWLDVVRYADSNGYHSDEARKIAPYRDYVIRSFNDNKPFDQFVVEQLAGDLLPEPTTEQLVASGFNMLLQTTSEGGGQPKEYIAKYAADRVRNTSQIFLGSTMGCAECHNHKYDPFTARDFYSFAAFFADIEQPAIGNPANFPVMTDDDRKQLADFDAQIAAQKTILATQTPELDQALPAWEAETKLRLNTPLAMSPWHTIGPFVDANFDAVVKKQFVDPAMVDLSQPVGELSWEAAPQYEDGKVIDFAAGDFSARYLYRTLTTNQPTTVQLSLGSDDAITVWLNGKQVHDNKVNRAAAADQDKVAVMLPVGDSQLLVKVSNGQGGFGFYFKTLRDDLSDDVRAILATDATTRTDEQKTKLAAYFRTVAPQLQPVRDQLAAIEAAKKAFEAALPRTMMTRISAPKIVRLLNRGNWMDESGPEMQPAVPTFLGTVIPNDQADPAHRPDRLDLARWIVRRDNPLTARTMVNRLWKLYFGQGLAMPLDDLGRQGALPTHPKLLDWMAADFMDSGWNVKQLIRTLVMSQTYRQSSIVTEDIRRKDPYNQLYARQIRFRLDAELVRDNALAVSGLLVDEVGGRSVYPYQPAGYWQHMNFPVREWPGDNGPNLYRRGVYTWWQRMFLHPSMAAFDAPSREECTVDRPRSNIPQQALVLLNDPTYVEAARAFAERILTEPGANADSGTRLNWAYQTAISRNVADREKTVLLNVLQQNLDHYQADPAAADEFLKVGTDPPVPDLSKPELAAWTAVARVILNLSETITRP